MSAIQEARRLVEHQATHPVLSLFFDLDPEVFATPPARASQVTSLTDEAQREIEGDESLSHDERMGLREAVQRVREYLLSDEPPFQGARALGIFCSVPDDLFEVVQIAHPVPGRVVIDRRPFVEPLVSAAGARRWCIALVNR